MKEEKMREDGIQDKMTSTDTCHLTSNFVESPALHVTFPESPTASKENLLDQGCPGSLTLAFKSQTTKQTNKQ